MESKISMGGKEIFLRGYPICTGVAIGKPFFFTLAEENIPEFSVSADQIDHEIDRFYLAINNSTSDLLFLQKKLQTEGGMEAAQILGAHIEMMRDPLITIEVEEEIRKKGKNTEYVFKTVMGEYEKKFSKITDEFFRERLKDFQDVSRRIIGHLRKHERKTLADLSFRTIVFAHELSPSDTAEANTEVIDAFVTRTGAETSHVAIMARAKGIPFVSNVDFPDLSISLPTQVIVDGRTGDVVINPSKATISRYRNEQKKIDIHVKGLKKTGALMAETIDGYRTKLSSNIEMFDELDLMQQYGGGSIGLFRTEYLFLKRDSFPSEEEQFAVYRNIVEKVEGHSSVIRTFDLGGDKLGNFHLSRFEKNPNLGCRAIRLMLKERIVFKTQLRAILRASAYGELSILLPMISDVEELRDAKAIAEEVREDLTQKGIPFSRSIPIGCMIEVPSAALTCDILAKECDFLSIGTNDLVQYCLAVDRGNPSMKYLYNPHHPSILRLIKMVATEGNLAKKPVSVCGEIAADPRFTALLLGLGVHELSVASPALPIVKNVIRKISILEARDLADYVMTLSDAVEIEQVLEEAYQKLNIS